MKEYGETESSRTMLDDKMEKGIDTKHRKEKRKIYR